MGLDIEEKAKEFAGYDNPSLQGIVTTTARMVGKYDGFKAGANWMLEKAMALIEHCEVFDKFGRQVKSETFRKVLEE